MLKNVDLENISSDIVSNSDVSKLGPVESYHIVAARNTSDFCYRDIR